MPIASTDMRLNSVSSERDAMSLSLADQVEEVEQVEILFQQQQLRVLMMEVLGQMENK